MMTGSPSEHASRRLAAALALAMASASFADAQTAEPAKRPVGALGADVLAEEAREQAVETRFPRFGWGLGVEVEGAATVDSSDPAAEIVNVFPTVGAALAVEFAAGSGLFSTLVMEQVADPTDDSAFEDVGLYVEELYAAVDVTGWVGLAGKFNPAFGQAWGAAPGVFGTSFAEDYQLTERLGAGVGIPFAALGQEHVISASGFVADSTGLSDSAFTSRGRLNRPDGGPSNDASPSFAVSLDGGLTEAIGYTAGLRFQQGGSGDPGDEVGAVGGLVWAIPVAGGEASLLGEVAWFRDWEATTDPAAFGTFGAAWAVDRWTVSGVYALRDLDGASTDHLATATVEYRLLDNLVAAFGYAYDRQGDEDSHKIGLVLAAEFGGVVPF